jgi:hypothetical protein
MNTEIKKWQIPKAGHNLHSDNAAIICLAADQERQAETATMQLVRYHMQFTQCQVTDQT